MRLDKVARLLMQKNLTEREVEFMPVEDRMRIGLPPIIPQVDYTPTQRFVEASLLGRWSALRNLFGLDQVTQIDPPYDGGDDDKGRTSKWMDTQTRFQTSRAASYLLFEEMDNYDTIYSILDLYAEEASQPDSETGRILWIDCKNDNIKVELMNMLNRLKMESSVFSIIRAMCKYGDCFEQVITSPSVGISNLRHVAPNRLTRIVDKLGRTRGFVPGIIEEPDNLDSSLADKTRLSDPWDFAHFRLQGSSRGRTHGESILYGARRVWRQLSMMEDSMVLYRLNRAADRDIYYIQTAGASPIQRWQAAHAWRREMRKQFATSTSEGIARQQYNPRTVDEDMYIPVTGKEDPTRVERQPGSSNIGDIFDVEHFRDKMFGALRVPKAFLGSEGDVNSKATLVSQDVRFARSIRRVQGAFKDGIRTLCEIQLALTGKTVRNELGQSIINFRPRMANINWLEDRARAEIFSIRQDVASKMLGLTQVGVQTDPKTGQPSGTGVIKNVNNWAAWVFSNFLGLNDTQIEFFLGPGVQAQAPDARAVRDLTEKSKHLEERGQVIREALQVLKEDDQEDCFEPLPVEIKDSKAEGKKEKIVYDLEEEEIKLRKTLNVGGQISLCTRCMSNKQESAMYTRLDESTGSNYLLCSKCGYTCIHD